MLCQVPFDAADKNGPFVDNDEPIMGTPENADRPFSITTPPTAPEKAPQRQSAWDNFKTGDAEKDTAILYECMAEIGDRPLPLRFLLLLHGKLRMGGSMPNLLSAPQVAAYVLQSRVTS